MSCGAAVAPTTGDASVGLGLEWAELVGCIVMGAREASPISLVVVGFDGERGPMSLFACSACRGIVLLSWAGV